MFATRFRDPILVSAAVLLLGASAHAEPKAVFPGKTWTHAASPEAVGWSSEWLGRAETYADDIGSTEVMIVHRGIVVGSWGDISYRSEAYSVRKSLLSALIGIAVDNGEITLSDSMAALGIDDNEPLTPEERRATVADLLKSRSGIFHPALYETRRMKERRPARGSHPPGTFWYYNNWDFNALATIYEKETGEKIFEAVDRHLAQPLQMQDFRPDDGRYVTGDESIHRAYPMRLSTRDLARFGLLYLRDGRWKDQQIVSAAWVKESTTSYSEVSNNRGYGYMWWTAHGESCFTGAGPAERCFYAAGNYKQRLLAIPDRDLVVVHRVNTNRTRVRVGWRDFNKLVSLIIDAGGAAVARSPR